MLYVYKHTTSFKYWSLILKSS